MTGTPKTDSSSASTRGGSAADDDRTNRRRFARPRPGFSRGAGQDRLVHRGDRRVPGGLRLGEVRHESQRVEARRTVDGTPGRQRREQARDEPVDVEQRHDVEAPVRRCEPQGLADVAGRRGEVALGQRARSSGRAVVPEVCSTSPTSSGSAGSHSTSPPARSRRTASVNSRHARRSADCRSAGRARRARARRDAAGRFRRPLGHHQRAGTEVLQAELDVLPGQRRVQRRGRGAACDRQERRREFGAIRQDDRDTIAPADSPAPEVPGRAVDLREQSLVVERRPAAAVMPGRRGHPRGGCRTRSRS